MLYTSMQLRSLALPFTVLEWTLPTVPRPVQNGPSRQSSLSPKGNTAVAPEEAASSTMASSSDSSGILYLPSLIYLDLCLARRFSNYKCNFYMQRQGAQMAGKMTLLRVLLLHQLMVHLGFLRFMAGGSETLGIIRLSCSGLRNQVASTCYYKDVYCSLFSLYVSHL